MPMKNINIMDRIARKAADELANEMDKEFLKYLDGELPDFEDIQYDSKKQDVDSEYLHNIKTKVEKLLQKVIDFHDIHDIISDSLRYRIDKKKCEQNNKYYDSYRKQLSIDGKRLVIGYDYIPVDFDDWIRTYLPHYGIAIEIYQNMCTSRRITKEDLIKLNKISRVYKDDSE